MRSFRRVLRAFLLCAAVLGLTAGAGRAQEQGMETQMGPGPMGRGMQQRGAAMCDQLDQHIDGDLAFLKTELKISEAQTPQWNIFAQAFREDREKRADLCRQSMEQSKEMRSAGLLDSLKMAEDQLAQRLDSLRAMKAALQPLYSSLSKDQKKTADQIMRGGQIF